jgi:hypothetical protein
MSWYHVPLWDLRPDITSCRNVTVWNMRSCFCGEPSLTIARVWNLQSLNGPSRAELVTILYCLTWESPSLEGQVPVFIFPRNRVAQGTGFLDIIHGSVLYLKLNSTLWVCPYLTGNTLRLYYEPNRFMISISLWRWYINISITILDIIHRPIQNIL